MTDSSVSVGPQEIGAVAENDEDNPEEFLGFLVFSTTGDAEVPREWLQEEWSNHNLPQQLFPREPTRWMAYRRAMRNLVDAEHKHFEVFNQEYGHTHECKFRLEKDQTKGSNTFLLYVDSFWPEELIGEEGGNWQETKVGRFDFHNPEEGPGGLLNNIEVEEDTVFYEKAYSMMGRGSKLFKRYLDTHVEADFQKVLQQMRDYPVPSAMPIRRAVYFFPANYKNTVEGVAAVWERMNQFKEGGEDMRVDYTPVVNLESQRELISSKAEEMVEEAVSEILNETLEAWDDDETADSIARDVMNSIGEAGIDETVAGYNQLLQARLSVKDVLKEQAKELTDAQEEVIDRVMNQKNINEV